MVDWKISSCVESEAPDPPDANSGESFIRANNGPIARWEKRKEAERSRQCGAIGKRLADPAPLLNDTTRRNYLLLPNAGPGCDRTRKINSQTQYLSHANE